MGEYRTHIIAERLFVDIPQFRARFCRSSSRRRALRPPYADARNSCSHSSLSLTIPVPSKLLEFPLQDDVRLMLGPMTFEMDLPKYANFPLSANAPFLYFDGGTDRLFSQTYERTVIDARTWAIYRFPVFSPDIVSGASSSQSLCSLVVIGRAYQLGVRFAVVLVHVALRKAHLRLSSRTAHEPSGDTHTGFRRPTPI